MTLACAKLNKTRQLSQIASQLITMELLWTFFIFLNCNSVLIKQGFSALVLLLGQKYLSRSNLGKRIYFSSVSCLGRLIVMVAPTLVANTRTKLLTSTVIRKLGLRARIRTTCHLLALPYVPSSKGIHSFPNRMTHWGPNVGDILHLNSVSFHCASCF